MAPGYPTLTISGSMKAPPGDGIWRRTLVDSEAILSPGVRFHTPGEPFVKIKQQPLSCWITALGGTTPLWAGLSVLILLYLILQIRKVSIGTRMFLETRSSTLTQVGIST